MRGRIGSEGDDVVHAGADRRDVEKTKVERHQVTGGQRRESERMMEGLHASLEPSSGAVAFKYSLRPFCLQLSHTVTFPY